MANRKLTQLPELTSLEDNDWGYVVDISDTSESPQGTSKKVRKLTLWDYIRGKADARYGTVTVISNQRYSAAGQDYILPLSGATATIAYIDDYPQHLEAPSFLSDLNTYTQTDDTVTFKQTIETGSIIRIYYHL